MATILRNSLAAKLDRAPYSEPSPIGALTHSDANVIRVHSAAPEGTLSAYADEIADFFDSRENRETRAIMSSNRAPFLS